MILYRTDKPRRNLEPLLCVLAGLSALRSHCPVAGQRLTSIASSSDEPPGRSFDSTQTLAIDARRDTPDHRVLLHPGRWKIGLATDAGGGTYLAYHFFLGFNWTKLKVQYPECSQVACKGLPDSHRGCDHLCSAGPWRDATATLETATLGYNRAAASLGSVLDDLAALMDTHIERRWGASDESISKFLSYHGEESESGPGVVDVMRGHRTLMDEALDEIAARSPNAFSNDFQFEGARPVSMSNNASKFKYLLDTWRSGAFTLAVRLNAVTFALQGARQRILLCAQGIQRSDVTGCEPDFIAEFYTDTPVASRTLSSRLVMFVERARWTPVALSHWYMPFVDSSKGNRICWLDRPMVSDMHGNYRVPQCDSRGVCEPLEIDNVTVSACEVNQNGEISLACPVACGDPCFGPICYQPDSDTYAPRTALRQGERGVEVEYDLVRVTKSPRVLSNVYSLSDLDVQTSLASVLNQSARSSELLRRGETLLEAIIAANSTARKYIDRVYAEMAAQSQGKKCSDCERTVDRGWFMAAASVTLSALTCPILIVLIVRLRSSEINLGLPGREILYRESDTH